MADASWIDSLLNFIIPPAVVIFLAYVLLNPFREPLGRLWNTIKNWKDSRGEQEIELGMNRYIEYD